MPEGTLQINLPPEVPGCASVKFKAGALPGFGHVCFQDRGMKTQTEIGQVRIIRNVRLHWNCPPVPVKGEDDIHLFFRQFKVKHLEKKGGGSSF